MQDKAAQFKSDLDAMDGEERKAYIIAVLKASPEYLDNLAPKLFTTEDIIEVRSNGLKTSAKPKYYWYRLLLF